MITVAIVDDHPMVLSGLAQMLQDATDMKLSGLYSSGQDFLQSLDHKVPDLLLLDLQLPDMQGEAIAQLILKEHPNLPIIILTSIDILYRVKKLLQMGCKGYSLKNITKEILQQAIRDVVSGSLYLDPVIHQALLQDAIHQKNTASLSGPDLTRREKEILGFLFEGLNSNEIGAKLFLSPRTVDNHRKSLMKKFEVTNTTKLMKAAKEMGFAE